MRSNYDYLGKYIRPVDVRNNAGKEENLLGITTQKFFMPSIANTIGTDFSKYKVVRQGQFTYVPDTSRRGDRIAIALLQDWDEGLVSNIYSVFEVVDEEKLCPEYLMLWFKRPEFGRYARFKSHGSVRELFDWEELCGVELPVPDVEIQHSIVRAYNTIDGRIKHLRKINDNLSGGDLRRTKLSKGFKPRNFLFCLLLNGENSPAILRKLSSQIGRRDSNWNRFKDTSRYFHKGCAGSVALNHLPILFEKIVNIGCSNTFCRNNRLEALISAEFCPGYGYTTNRCA